MESFDVDQVDQSIASDPGRDLGGDGEVLEIVDQLAEEVDGDGYADRVTLLISKGSALVVLDEDGDNEFDVGENVTMTREELAATDPGLLLLLDQQLGLAEGTGADIEVDEFGIPLDVQRNGTGMIGTPDNWSGHWFNESANGNAVPAGVAQIIAEYSGVKFLYESAFVELAQDTGLILDADAAGRMTPADAQKLLNLSRVLAAAEYGDVGALAEALADGRGVMVGAASGQDDAGDLCVVVSGIDVEVPIAQFEDAWVDSGNAMIVCDQPAPEDGEEDMTAEVAVNPKLAEILENAGASDHVSEGAAAAIGATVDWLTERPRAIVPEVLSVTKAGGVL